MENKQQVVFGPKSLKQEMFLNTTADVCCFGGGASSGKSYLAIMDLIRWVEDPMFRGLVVRKLTPQIHGPGGVFEKAVDLYRSAYGSSLKIRKRDGEIEFPSKAKVVFRHMQREEDKYSLQGWEVSAAVVDEAQQLGLPETLYIMSRLRTAAKMKPYIRLTCNPDRGSYLYDFVEFYLLEDGTPDPEKCGMMRYFVNFDSNIFWGNTREELIQKFGPNTKPLSFTFISANVYDNPVQMERDPGYVAWLEGLPRTEKARLLDGNWKVTPMQAGFYKSEWTPIVNTPDERIVKMCIGTDFAATLESEVNKDPDYSAFVVMGKGDKGTYYVMDVLRFRDRFAGVEQKLFEFAEKWGKDCTINLAQDPGSAGKAYAADLSRRLSEKGFYCRIRPSNQSKVMRFAPFANMAELGHVKLLRGEWNREFITELEYFSGDGKNHDDMVDGCSEAFAGLKSSLILPSFSLPSDFTNNNQYNPAHMMGIR